MKTRIMRCKVCGCDSFRFRWEYKEEEEITLLLCHDGYGFQFEDSFITCNGCGLESPYEKENFIQLTEFKGGML